MKPNEKFSSLPKAFWASVRSISQRVGYTVRGQGQVKVPSIEEITIAFEYLNLNPENIILNDIPSELAITLIEYYTYRADILNNFVEPRLMNAERAKTEFEALFEKNRKENNNHAIDLDIGIAHV